MVAVFVAQPISRSTLTGIRSRLVKGLGFFVDGPYRYAVADRAFFELRVVRRIGEESFTDAVAALPAGYRVVINGNYFTGSRLYARAVMGVVNSTDVDSVGDVYQNGILVERDAPDTEDSTNYFYFGYSTPPPRYVYDAGNAPPSLREGMGGLGPLILRNPVTGKPLRYGIGNRYASKPKKTTVPKSPADWSDCTQRNNNTYASIQRETQNGRGVCAVAVCEGENIVLLIIKPHGEPGDLDTLRDSLFDAGIDGACFTDGSNSACMATDRSFDFTPHWAKNHLIEYGFALFYLAPDVRLRVDFLVLTVLNDAYIFGKGRWTIRAQVNGSVAGSFAAREVDTNEVISLNWTQTLVVRPSINETLQIRITGRDEAGGDDDLGTVNVQYDEQSANPWGIGAQVYTSPKGFYTFTAVITRLP